MPINRIRTSSTRRRAPRQDGEDTRRAILETAGEMFAERGYADTTSKDICAAAKANSAAVNYYFGGKEGLYREVLVEAHQHLVNRDDLEEIAALHVEPEEKLRVFFRRLLLSLDSPANRWGIKIFLRELGMPSQAVKDALPEAVFPKVAILRRLISDIINRPVASAEVQRGVAFVVLPCISLIMFPEGLRTKILPATTITDQSLIDDMARYALAGLKALRDK